MSVELTIIDKNLLDHYWPLVWEWLVKACNRNPSELCLAEIYHDCTTGEMQLWLACDTEAGEALGCMVTSLKIGKDGSRFAYIHIATGKEMKRWFHLFSEFAATAKEQGCTHVISLARRGWERVLKNTGASVRHIEMKWDL